MSIRKKNTTNLEKPVSIKIKKGIVKKILRNGKNSEIIILEKNSLNVINSPLETLNLEILFSLARYYFESNSVQLFDCDKLNVSWIIDKKGAPFTNIVSLSDLLSNMVSLYNVEINDKEDLITHILSYLEKRKLRINKKFYFPKKFPLITLSIFLKFDILLFNSYETLELAYHIFKDLYESKIIDQQYQPIFLATDNKKLSDRKSKAFKSVKYNHWYLQV